ncbi:hypothetical protein ACA910_014172 [Epithemia clementina (nom. ined.)]
MGNSIAKEFKMVELGQGALDHKELIAPGSVVLDQAMTVLVRYDDNRKSTIFFDFSTMLPLYVSSTKMVDNNTKITVTKDNQGKTLFLTTYPTKGKRLIYRAPKDLATKGSSSSSSSSSSKSSDPLSKLSSHSSRTAKTDPLGSCSSHSRRSACSSASVVAAKSFVRYQQEFQDDNDPTNSEVPCAAQIDLDRSGAAVCAFLSVVVWKGSGPQLCSVYKAVLVPQVKYGALVLDMQGQVVGKAFLDDRRMQPMIKVAQGADVPSVVALASALLGDFP